MLVDIVGIVTFKEICCGDGCGDWVMVSAVLQAVVCSTLGEASAATAMGTSFTIWLC